MRLCVLRGIESPVEFFEGRVAITGNGFQSRSLEDVNVSAAILNEPLLLQLAGSCDNGHPFRSQQFTESFRRDIDDGRLGKVLCMQKPAGETLRGSVDAMTAGNLTQRMDLGLHKFKYPTVNRFILLECSLQMIHRIRMAAPASCIRQ